MPRLTKLWSGNTSVAPPGIDSSLDDEVGRVNLNSDVNGTDTISIVSSVSSIPRIVNGITL